MSNVGWSCSTANRDASLRHGSSNARAGAILALAILTGTASLAILSPNRAGADTLSNARAQASTLEAQLAATSSRLDQLDQQYEASQYELQQVDARIIVAQSKLAAARHLVAIDRLRLRREAIWTYTSEGTSSPVAQLFTSARSTSGIASVYAKIAVGNAANAIDRLDQAALRLQAQQKSLEDQRSQAASARSSISNAAAEANGLQKQEQTLLSSANKTVASLVLQRQAQQQAAAQAASVANAAAAAAAVARSAAQTNVANAGAPSVPAPTSSSPPPTGGGGAGASSGPPLGGGGGGSAGGNGGGTTNPPPSSSGGEIAVRAAEAELGVPYVWGGGTYSGPSGSASAPANQLGQPGFDCSGLVMYAWAQAGVDLAHYTGAQFQETARVPLSDIQPGDLLFYGPGASEHVAMYIGGGMMIEAPETGQDVRITPIRTDPNSDAADGYEPFVGAGRP
ncbi:MAG: C40 family peptidase [Acidimicrobiales bacterium]